MDTLSVEQRSLLMSRIRGADTKPELAVRSLLHRMGLRFRLHRRDLPGSPDIVLPRHATVVFVHGCFWHRHPGCKGATTPKTTRGPGKRPGLKALQCAAQRLRSRFLPCPRKPRPASRS